MKRTVMTNRIFHSVYMPTVMNKLASYGIPVNDAEDAHAAIDTIATLKIMRARQAEMTPMKQANEAIRKLASQLV